MKSLSQPGLPPPGRAPTGKPGEPSRAAPASGAAGNATDKRTLPRPAERHDGPGGPDATGASRAPQLLSAVAGEHTVPPSLHAQRYAEGLVRLHRLERQRADDLHSGARMQSRFLTPAHAVETMLRPYGYEAAILHHTPHPVCGDFLCSRTEADGTACLMLADTAGHGLSAALLSIRIAALMQTVPAVGSPGDFLEFVHDDILGLTPSGRFVTAVCAELRHGSVTLANAGLPLPVHIRDGSVREIPTSGIPLGLPLGAGQYRETTVAMEPGDRLVLYTDGVTEAENPAGDKLPRALWMDWMQRFATGDVHHMLHHTADALRRFMGNAPSRSDLSVIILERRF